MKKNITIVIPCFNESKNIEEMFLVLNSVIQNIKYDFKILYIDDGSSDNSINILTNLSSINNNVFFIELSKNVGKDNAIKAGIDICNSDCIITIDADLQHPPNLIPEMIKKWDEGYEVIYAFRENKNPHTSFLHKKASSFFWRILNKLSTLKLEDGISDFQLLDKKVLNSIKEINENEIFLRGIIKWVGFKQFGIPYTPKERFSGKTTYSKIALLKLAIQGITSFSITPLYFAIILGISITTIATLFFLGYIFFSFYYQTTISGWASVITTVVFFGGLNLIILGIIGVYIGKIFMQSKGRPNYLISNTNYK